MKYIIIAVVLVLLAVGGYAGYTYLMKQAGTAPVTTSEEKSGTVTRTGVIQKLTKPGDDYTHMLRSDGEMIPLNSYTVTLDSYVNKTVTVEGQYSGNTLFVDKIQ